MYEIKDKVYAFNKTQVEKRHILIHFNKWASQASKVWQIELITANYNLNCLIGPIETQIWPWRMVSKYTHIKVIVWHFPQIRKKGEKCNGAAGVRLHNNSLERFQNYSLRTSHQRAHTEPRSLWPVSSRGHMIFLRRVWTTTIKQLP